MQREEDVEVAVEPCPVVAQAIAKPVRVQGSLAAPDLLAEVAAPGGEEVLPGSACEREGRRRVGAQNRCLQQRPPFAVTPQRLAEEDVRPYVLQHGAQRGSGPRPVVRRAERPELVGRSVSDQANCAYADAPAEVEREYGERLALGGAASGRQRPRRAAEAAPPRRRPFPRPEDVLAALSHGVPLVPERGEGRCVVDARVAHRRRRTKRKPSTTSTCAVEL